MTPNVHIPVNPLTADELRAWARYDEIWEILTHGDTSDFVALQAQEPGFPHGADPVFDRPWLTNAIHAGSERAVVWMIAEGVDLSYRDDEGFTAIMSAVGCKDTETRHTLLRILLVAGAKYDIVGSNCWTAAHFAACYNDVEALKILKEHGADLCAATEDLGSWRSPADVARFHKHMEALEYLDSVCCGNVNRVYRPNVQSSNPT